METLSTVITRATRTVNLPDGIDPIVRLPAVLAITGLSKGWVRNNVLTGEFPAPLRLGEKAVGWRMSSIQNWLESRQVVTNNQVKG